MTVRILRRALAELQATVAFIGRDNPGAAAALADDVFATIEQLAAGRYDGPETVLRSGHRVRSWPVPPLRIYYQRRDTDFCVLRIYHHARRPIAR